MVDVPQPHRSSHRSKSRRRSSSRGQTWLPSSGLSRRQMIYAFGLIVVTAIVAIPLRLHYSSDVTTDAAVNPFWRKDGAAGLIAAADDLLQQEPPAVGEAADLLKQALEASPLNVTALAMLASAEQQLGDNARATQLYDLAFARTKRDVDVLRWKAQRAADPPDAKALVYAIDLMLRLSVDPSKNDSLLQALTQLVAEPSSTEPLVEALMRRPNWANAFLTAVSTGAQSDRAADLLSSLPPDIATDDVWSVLLARLIGSGQGPVAYSLWVTREVTDSSEAIPYLNDGGFERMQHMLPFDWNIRKTKGVEVTRTQEGTQDGGFALKLDFVSPVMYRHVWQYLSLAPGIYTLSGSVKLDSLVAARGLQWRVMCVNDSFDVIGESELLQGNTPWRKFEASLTVPDTGCDTQLLRLEVPARIQAENAITGTAWFDAMDIQRQPSGQK